MHYLTLTQILQIHEQIISQSGGEFGIRDIGGLESALAQPQMTFDGRELYPTLEEKASALAFSIIQNHPFVDGNKRTGHAAMEILLILNGFEIHESVDKQERVILSVASGNFTRGEFSEWLKSITTKREK